jgi:hypothetical protein
MGNRSWILPVKTAEDLTMIRNWLTTEDLAGILDFHYVVRSPFSLDGRRTPSPNYYLCASSDGSSAIESLFEEGYGHEPLLLDEADISDKTFELGSGWYEAQYSTVLSLDDADYNEDVSGDSFLPED